MVGPMLVVRCAAVLFDQIVLPLSRERGPSHFLQLYSSDILAVGCGGVGATRFLDIFPYVHPLAPEQQHRAGYS